MTGIIIRVLLGLFIWMVLPHLIYGKRKYKNNTAQYFAVIACKIVGIAVIVFGGLDLVKILLNF
jgi:hypothetical protein